MRVLDICRRHRDVALLSLANVLHRSQHSKDAVILLLSAIDLSPHLFIHHFTLGNVYAVSYSSASQVVFLSCLIDRCW